ncbi:Rossmann-like and DUF2520 domain-containing protein [Sphingopyxis sp.]|uniref:Rossmann-like and DUF2520 domain-containing protein n=1 Tax=Sphingopyxis sp. TaxID=1908224 RepID=UPI0035B317CC
MTIFRQVGIIGSGRVAQALVLGLAPHSGAPVLLWGRSPDRAGAAAARVRAIAAHGLAPVAKDCDLIAIAVSDDAVATVAAELAEAVSKNCAAFAFHVSGRSGASLLGPLQTAGMLTGAIHPAMTFTGDPQAEVRRMTEARFAVTGSSPAAEERARQVVALLGGIAVHISEGGRPLYHAALCHASNHLVTLLAGASHALRNAGVDDPAALIAPLVRAALENSLDRGFAALSGPLLRGDDHTIEGHLEALAAACPDLLPAYRAMALATLDELGRKERSALRRALDSGGAVP